MLLLSCLGIAQAENLNSLKLKAAACGQCHDNENNTNSSLPHLQGQNSAYLIQQIKLFLKGVRKHPVLGTANNKTSKTQIEFFASYFSNMKAKRIDLQQVRLSSPSLTSQSYTQIIQQGESIYSPCSGCHGMEAEGIAPYPKLAGQQFEYLKQQLIEFKTGQRNNKIMQIMTVNLSAEDISALAIYLATLNKMETQTNKLSQQ